MSTGLRTWLPKDVKKQNFVRDKIVASFTHAHYEPIEIPTLVDADLIKTANRRYSETTFQFSDAEGNLLALRPEHTQPIAQTVASRVNCFEFPLRLYYASSVFRYSGLNFSDDSREVQQVGLEFIGEAGLAADDEVLNLVLSAADSLELKDYKVFVTDSALWSAAFDKYPDIAEKAYENLLEGDLIALAELVPADHPLQMFLKSTSVEDFEQEFDLDLSDLKALLNDAGENVVFDPSQCPDLKLYTGVHFVLHAEGSGQVIARGGRYDDLCSSFGADLPAIGFAFYLSRLVAVLQKQGALENLDGMSVSLSEKSHIQGLPSDDERSWLKSNESKRNEHNIVDGGSATGSKVFRIALAKGGLFDDAMSFLNTKGISIPGIANSKEAKKSRKLILKAESTNPLFPEVEVLLVRNHDVPVYVENGAADLGVVGYDVIRESGTKLTQLKDLEFGPCRLSVCAKKDLFKSVMDLPSHTRIATSFPELTKEFFKEKGISVEVMKLYGSVELGPLTELSDVIVDLVATGTTLRENGLEVIEEIMPCTARLIANDVSFKMNKAQMLEFAS